MAKQEQPQIYVQRRGSSLIPEMEMDRDLIERLPAGQRVKITVTEGRSPAKLRLYWAYLGRVIKATDCAPTVETLHVAVKMNIGLIDHVLIRGFPMAVARSIAFNSMKDSEFDEFLAAAEKWIIETYGISIEDAFSERAA